MRDSSVLICGMSSYWEKLPEPFHVQLAECRQKLFNQVAAHAHAWQLLSPQIFNIFHSGLEIDCALQSTRLSKNLLGKCIFRVEGRGGRKSPAQGREAADHESAKSRKCCLGGRGAISGSRGNIGSAPGTTHPGKNREGHLGRRKVVNVLGKVLNGGDDSFEQRLVSYERLDFSIGRPNEITRTTYSR